MLPDVDCPEGGFESPNIFALASSYRRCFSCSSRCCRFRASSGVSCFFSALGSSSSSSVNCSSPVVGSLLVIIWGAGFRLRSFTAGLNEVVSGTEFVVGRNVGCSGASL